MSSSQTQKQQQPTKPQRGEAEPSHRAWVCCKCGYFNRTGKYNTCSRSTCAEKQLDKLGHTRCAKCRPRGFSDYGILRSSKTNPDFMLLDEEDVPELIFDE
ncbi:hypothetical protein BDY21DRAFT_367914 [Lineolata rhizophorae]|uniref:RanBP2-type domain-containing protein n=1 Tax=Lineolata rhizophorae TaxID=578093 RepID=A0A6A6NKY4_9PEZI|nr:hypothetical protein BDY21DRAFT_367914 [Lineolata rhizophorae]